MVWALKASASGMKERGRGKEGNLEGAEVMRKLCEVGAGVCVVLAGIKFKGIKA